MVMAADAVNVVACCCDAAQAGKFFHSQQAIC